MYHLEIIRVQARARALYLADTSKEMHKLLVSIPEGGLLRNCHLVFRLLRYWGRDHATQR